MANMTIPRGIDYSFNIIVKEADSFLPKDLTAFDTGTISIIHKETKTKVITSNITVDSDPLSGIVHGTILGTDSVDLEIDRGAVEDRLYSKPNYQALVTIKFNDGTKDIVVIIDNISVAVTGV